MSSNLICLARYFFAGRNMIDCWEGTNMGDLIHETLGLFEKHGGEDAFINIKFS